MTTIENKINKSMKHTAALIMALGLALPATALAQTSDAPAPRDGDRPPRQERREDGARPARESDEGRPARPERREQADRPQRGESGDRAERPERPERPAAEDRREPRAGRAPRAEGAERREPRGERPPRPEGGERRERVERAPRGERPERGPRGEMKEGRGERMDKAPRGERRGRGPAGGRREGAMQHRGPAVAPLFALLDVNDNGVIDRREMKRAPQVLHWMDKDSDGALSVAELRSGRAARMESHPRGMERRRDHRHAGPGRREHRG